MRAPLPPPSSTQGVQQPHLRRPAARTRPSIADMPWKRSSRGCSCWTSDLSDVAVGLAERETTDPDLASVSALGCDRPGQRQRQGRPPRQHCDPAQPPPGRHAASPPPRRTSASSASSPSWPPGRPQCQATSSLHATAPGRATASSPGAPGGSWYQYICTWRREGKLPDHWRAWFQWPTPAPAVEDAPLVNLKAWMAIRRRVAATDPRPHPFADGGRPRGSAAGPVALDRRASFHEGRLLRQVPAVPGCLRGGGRRAAGLAVVNAPPDLCARPRARSSAVPPGRAAGRDKRGLAQDAAQDRADPTSPYFFFIFLKKIGKPLCKIMQSRPFTVSSVQAVHGT